MTLNGVMMGLSQREARRRLDAVLDFAELEEFVDLKLKNYSSGMLVRLAFSVMIQAEADILLIDEVLAVGDAAFQQKCRDVFAEMRDSDRTVVLVTHDMTAVQRYCHRAMLLDDGEVLYLGDPEEAGRQYLRMNFAKRRITIGGGREVALVPDILARVSDAWLENEGGERIENVEAGRADPAAGAHRGAPGPDRPRVRAAGEQRGRRGGLRPRRRRSAPVTTARPCAWGRRRSSAPTSRTHCCPAATRSICWVAVTRDEERGRAAAR